MSCKRSRTQYGAQQHTGIIFQLQCGFTRGCHFQRLIEKTPAVDTADRGRHDAKQGQHRETSADIRFTTENMHKAVSPGALLQAGPGICNGNKALRRLFRSQHVGQTLQEIGHENVRFQRTTRFTGNNKRRMRSINRRFNGPDLTRVGRIQHDQLRKARLLPKRSRDHFRGHTGTPHPQQHHLPDIARCKITCKGFQLG